MSIFVHEHFNTKDIESEDREREEEKEKNIILHSKQRAAVKFQLQNKGKDNE